MADLFVVDFGGSADDERARRDAERSRVRARYVTQLVTAAVVDAATAERVVATIFDYFEPDGSWCPCECHPSLSTAHKDGTDCPCTWDDARREREREQWHKSWNSPEASAEVEPVKGDEGSGEGQRGDRDEHAGPAE